MGQITLKALPREFFPLPIPHEDRTDPLDFIPDADDPCGHGERMWRIMSRLTITQGKLAGQRLGAMAPPWQEKWIRTLYGATDRHGRRRFDEALLLIAKKNGKSTLAGMLGVAHTLAFPEDRGTGVILADTKEQAGLAYDCMASTIEADKDLLRRFHVRRYRSDVLHRETGTVLKAVSAELASTVGTAPNFYIVDEVHLLGMKPRGAELVRQLSSGASVRQEPLGIYITTAPIGPASGIYQALINRARRVVAGEAPDDRLFPVLFEMPNDTDPDDPARWWMANPSLGKTFDLDWLRREWKIAKDDGDPGAYVHFLSQHLNIPAQERIGVDRWLPLSIWDACADPSLDLDTLVKASIGGLWLSVDAGGRDDPTCLGVLGELGDEQYGFWAHQWLHRDGYEKRRHLCDYDAFIAAGDLTIVDDDDGDIRALENTVRRLKQHVNAVGVDPYGLKDVTNRMSDELGLTVHGMAQGWKMTPHLYGAERAIHGRRLTHYGGPMLRWNIENARIEERKGAIALTKPSGASVGTDKIDGAVCLVMALALADTVPSGRSTYEDHGVRFL